MDADIEIKNIQIFFASKFTKLGFGLVLMP
jgi:hypothetical protein